jgi:hypothetical protein
MTDNLLKNRALFAVVALVFTATTWFNWNSDVAAGPEQPVAVASIASFQSK